MERPSRIRWPVGLLGMLVLVSLVETTIARQPIRFTETATLSWKLAFEAIPREADSCEVACLGDSLVKIGVIPEVIRAGSGRSTYNFAMAQAPAPASYFALRRLIEAGGRPACLVVDFKPSVLAGGPRFSLRHWQAVASLREMVELAMETRSPGLLVEIALGRALPSYRSRLEIREAVRSALLAAPSPTETTNRLALRNWGINRGAHLNSPTARFAGELGAEDHRKLLSDSWKCHRINATYVDRFLTLAEARGIPVFWLIPPFPPKLQARREASGVDAAYLAFVDSMQAKHPSLTVVDGRASGYDDATFADHTHLNARGAIALSRDLAAIVGPKKGSGTFNWKSDFLFPGKRKSLFQLKVPDPFFGPGAFAVEDVDQSRVALEVEAARR